MRMPVKSAGDFTPPPAGTHIAVCIKVIDLGTQAVEWQGQTKLQHKIMLAWELPFEPMDDGRPFTHTQRYTFSSSDKATFRKHLEGWRGKKFEDSDFGPNGFDVKNVLGKPCSIIITHSTKGEKTYANTDGIGPVPRGTKAPAAVNPLVYFSLEPDKFDRETFDAFGEGLKAVIAKSPEYVEAINGPAPDHNEDERGHEPDDSEIPF